MKTIIQTIGPLYGEVVNGSVFGQPNGSEARPPQNVPAEIILSGDSGTLTHQRTSGTTAWYEVSGVDMSILDAASKIVRINAIFKNASDQIVAAYSNYLPASLVIAQGLAANIPDDGDTLTLVVTGYDSYGNKISTSNTLTITAVIPE